MTPSPGGVGCAWTILNLGKVGATSWRPVLHHISDMMSVKWSKTYFEFFAIRKQREPLPKTHDILGDMCLSTTRVLLASVNQQLISRVR